MITGGSLNSLDWGRQLWDRGRGTLTNKGPRLGRPCWPFIPGGGIVLIPTAGAVRGLTSHQDLGALSVLGATESESELETGEQRPLSQLVRAEILLFSVSCCVTWVHSPNLSEPQFFLCHGALGVRM